MISNVVMNHEWVWVWLLNVVFFSIHLCFYYQDECPILANFRFRSDTFCVCVVDALNQYAVLDVENCVGQFCCQTEVSIAAWPNLETAAIVRWFIGIGGIGKPFFASPILYCYNYWSITTLTRSKWLTQGYPSWDHTLDIWKNSYKTCFW